MNVYTFNSPGTTAVIVAKNEDQGARIINRELRKKRQRGNVQPSQLTEVAVYVANAQILSK